jgi:hypothetical protein
MKGNYMANESTTAQILGAYRRELEAEGLDPSDARTLVIEAARSLLREEPLLVGFDAPGMTLLRVAIPVDSSHVKDRATIERAASEAALLAVEEATA